MLTPRDIVAIVEGQPISGWQSGSIESSMITPADRFVLRIPFSAEMWRTLRRDARISIKIDGTVMLVGFIDKRDRAGLAGTLEISGRDVAGRLCDESAPAIDYTGLTILEAVRRLVSPWFESVGISNARNRRLRRGRGRRVASQSEPVVTINVRVPRRGAVHPGESRMSIIREILSRSGLVGFPSADSKEFVICKANHSQAPQFLLSLGAPDGKIETNVRDLSISEDSGDRYSLYRCGGMGGQTDTNFGKNAQNNGAAFDNPFNRVDGTGRDFIHPKRMYMPERAFDSFGDADRVAELEKARRDFRRHVVTIEAPDMGQSLAPGEITLFAPDTVARVIDEEAEIDDSYLIFACSYNFSRDRGDWTTLHLVPTGTEIVL